MLYKLYTHLTIKYYVKHMTTKQLNLYLSSFDVLQNRLRNRADLPLQVSLNLMSIFKPYISKELKRRK